MGSTQPTIQCLSDLPQYSTTTQQPTTQPPVTTQPTTQPPVTTQPTTQPPVTTQNPTTQPPATTQKPSTQDPGAFISVPVISVSDWPVGNGIRRMNGRCSFNVSDIRDVGALQVNVSFPLPTSGYEVRIQTEYKLMNSLFVS